MSDKDADSKMCGYKESMFIVSGLFEKVCVPIFSKSGR